MLVVGWKAASVFLVFLSRCRVFSWLGGGCSQTSVPSVGAFTLSSGTNKKIPVKFSCCTLLRAATPLCRMWRRRAETCSRRRRVCVYEDVCVHDGGGSEVGARRGGSHGATEPSRPGLFDLWLLTRRGWWDNARQRSVTQKRRRRRKLWFKSKNRRRERGWTRKTSKNEDRKWRRRCLTAAAAWCYTVLQMCSCCILGNLSVILQMFQLKKKLKK